MSYIPLYSNRCKQICEDYKYKVTFTGVGKPPEGKEDLGYCSQVAVLTNESDDPNDCVAEFVYSQVSYDLNFNNVASYLALILSPLHKHVFCPKRKNCNILWFMFKKFVKWNHETDDFCCWWLWSWRYEWFTWILCLLKQLWQLSLSQNNHKTDCNWMMIRLNCYFFVQRNFCHPSLPLIENDTQTAEISEEGNRWVVYRPRLRI